MDKDTSLALTAEDRLAIAEERNALLSEMLSKAEEDRISLETEMAEQLSAHRQREALLIRDSYSEGGHFLPVPESTVDSRDFIEGGHYPVLAAIPSLSCRTDSKLVHVLVEGDCLSAMSAFTPTLSGSFDLIFLDPPHKMPEGEFGVDPRHEMQAHLAARFYSASLLMSPRGSCFITASDKTIEHVISVGKKVFGSDRMYPLIVWEGKENTQNSGGSSGQLQSTTTFIVGFYGEEGPVRSDIQKQMNKSYPFEDELGAYRHDYVQEIKENSDRYRENLNRPILGVLPKEGHCWRFGETSQKTGKKRRLVVVDGRLAEKKYMHEEGGSVIPFTTNLGETVLRHKEVGSFAKGKRELNGHIGDDHGFGSVTPLDLLRFLVWKFASRPDARILDPYAGSGSMLEAVVMQNNIDGGNRQAFLINTDEPVSLGKHSPQGTVSRDIMRRRVESVIESDWGSGQGAAFFTLSKTSASQVRKHEIAGNRSGAQSEKSRSVIGALPSVASVSEGCYITLESNPTHTLMSNHDASKIVLVWKSMASLLRSIGGESLLSVSRRVKSEHEGAELFAYFPDVGSTPQRLSEASSAVASALEGWKTKVVAHHYASTIDAIRTEVIARGYSSTVEDFDALLRKASLHEEPRP